MVCKKQKQVDVAKVTSTEEEVDPTAVLGVGEMAPLFN